MLWFLKNSNFKILNHRVKDWLRYPELVILEHIDWLPFILFGVFCYLFGELTLLNNLGIQTSGQQLFVWGFLLSTVMLYHGTYTINSLAHCFGKKRYDSGNHYLLRPDSYIIGVFEEVDKDIIKKYIKEQTETESIKFHKIGQ